MQEISLIDVIGRLMPALVLVVGGLLLVRRMAMRQRGGVQRSMRVVARVGLSRAASVQVIQVGGQHYLVGATEQNVNLLAELDEDVVLELNGPTTNGPRSTGFAKALAGASQDAGGDTGTARTTPEGPWTGLVARLQEATLRRARDPGDGRVT